MKTFNVKLIEKQLLEINKKNGVTTKAAVQLITNNLELYNNLLERYIHEDEQKLVFILYQINGQIFKQLKEFKILPASVVLKDTKDEDAFNAFTNKFKPKVKKILSE